MRIKSYYQWEVYEIAKQLVLCQIKILPRKIYFFFGQHNSHKTHRWMTIEDWATFENEIATLLTKRTSEGSIFKNIECHKETHVNLNPSIKLTIKKLNDAQTPDFIAEEYAEKSFKLILQCTIEHVSSDDKHDRHVRTKDRNNNKSDSLRSTGKDDVSFEDAKRSSQNNNEKIDQKEVDENENKIIDKTSKLSKRNKEDKISESNTQCSKNKQRSSSRKRQESKSTLTPEAKKLDRSSSTNRESSKKRRLHDCSQEQNMLSKWLTTKVSKQSKIENNENKPKKSASTRSKTTQWLESKEDLDKRFLLEKQQLQDNEELAEYLRGKIKTVPENYKYLNLMDLSKNKILKSLVEFKEPLDVVFKAFENKDYVHGDNGINHYLVINIINTDIQLEMMNAIGEAYKCDNASLIANALLPEWIICLFMQQHGLSRISTIEQLKLQEQFHIKLNEKTMDNGLDNMLVKRRGKR